MQIAAILTVAAEQSPRRMFSLVGRNNPETNRSFGKTEILGASLLDRTLGKLEKLGTLPPKVLSGGNVSDHVLPSRSTRSGSFIDSWEKALSGYANAGWKAFSWSGLERIPTLIMATSFASTVRRAVH